MAAGRRRRVETEVWGGGAEVNGCMGLLNIQTVPHHVVPEGPSQQEQSER